MIEGGDIHVCFAHYSEEKVEKINCPNCKSDQDFLCQFEEWYGWTITCLNCGDRWQDGELCLRPFQRNWREERKINARDRATALGWKRQEVKD